MAEQLVNGAFRAWLSDSMRGRRMSQEQLAQRSAVHRSTISRLLSGERQPTLETAVRLASVFSDGGDGHDAHGPVCLVNAATTVNADPVARVERALRAHSGLDDAGVRRMMLLYHELRA